MHHRRSALTMIRHLLCAALVPASAVTSLAGCASPPDPPPPDEAPPGVASLPATLGPAPGCTGERWVGAASACSPVTAGGVVWNASPVFASPPPGLAPYCLYTWGDPTTDPTPGQITAFVSVANSSGIQGLSEDCVVVGPLAGGAVDVNGPLRAQLSDELFQAAGGLAQLPEVVRESALRRIRIAVADTSPDSKDAGIPAGRSHHGYSMGWIAQRLACPGGTDDPRCRTDVTTHLALPRVTSAKVDELRGGYFGTPVELAGAIYEAVASWKQQASDGPGAQERLVINLSVGWQPALDSCPERDAPSLPTKPLRGTLDDDMVFGALIHAACHGALVIAAAGNDPGGGSLFEDGPTCPAAWQNVRAPTQTECEAFEGAGYADSLPAMLPLLPSPAMAIEEKPLIYGIGGVDYTGAPLSTTRRGSLGRHAAIAFHGVGVNPDGGVLPAPLTGSSTAAAIVSGAAAALWAYRPHWTGHRIMALLHRTGSPVDGYESEVADLGLALDNPAIPGPLHRISLCRAFAGLCSSSPVGCVAASACSAPVPSPFQSPMLSPELSQMIGDFYQDATHHPAKLTNETPAHHDHPTYQSAYGVRPSPIQPVCGGPCVLDVGQKRLMVSIDASSTIFNHTPLTNMMLMLEDESGSAEYFAAPSLSGGLKAGDTVVVEPIDFTLPPSRATLVFEITQDSDTASVFEPIVITDTPPANNP